MKAKARFAGILGALLLLGVALIGGGGSSAAAEGACPNEVLRAEQHATELADCRAYEMVSPPDKNGGDVMPYTQRTRASSDGEALSYAGLVPFGEAQGTGVAVEHMALRGPTGWASHAITPKVDAASLKFPAGTADTYYDNAFSPDFERGITFATKPVTDDPNVEDVVNLYRRTDLRKAGAGHYDLLTECPLCAETGEPLPPLPEISSSLRPFVPALAGTSPDMEHIAFESVERLTKEAPSQSPLCGNDPVHLNPEVAIPGPFFCAPRAYEWDEGQLHLAGVLPNGEPADVSLLGVGARNFKYTPHVVSDGSDGHTRVFFVQPTNDEGGTFNELPELDPESETYPIQILMRLGFLGQQQDIARGNLFARIDNTETVQLNESERTETDNFAPANYEDASVDGRRVFFTTKQALTEDATPGNRKIYMYDMTKPPSDPHNLTLISPDGQEAGGIWGMSNTGDYVYFNAGSRIYLWHEGSLHDIGPDPGGSPTQEDTVVGADYGLLVRQSRVTPDGRYLLFSTDNSSEFGGQDLGTCPNGFHCHELFLYSAESNQVACVSCNPSGSPSATSGFVSNGGFNNKIDVSSLNGGARVTTYLNRGITNDGSKVYFSSGDPLVPEDTNGRYDAYEYDVATRSVHLLSSGKDPANSFYLDSSADGRDVFIGTRQPLTGWDTDNSYDVYDVRAGGGFAEPPPKAPPCGGGECQGPLSSAPAAGAIASGAQGRGNPKPKTKVHCPKGKRKLHRNGKVRCVRKHHKANRTNTNRRAGR